MNPLLAACCLLGADMDADAKAFVNEHLRLVRPLEIRAGKAWWDANTTGKEEFFKAKEEAQNALDAALANQGQFARIQAVAGRCQDPLLARQIALLRLQYLEKQVDPDLLKAMTAKANAIEKAFNAYRAKPNGEEMADSKVREVLKSATDGRLRQQVWEASKGVGGVVEKDLKELVGLRNQAARKLSFADFHDMMLQLNEQKQGDVLALFDELDALTRGPFLAAKAEIDAKLAASYGIAPAALMPWHYHDPFFQEPPAVFKVDLDGPFRKADVLKLCRDYYQGIGLPIDDVLARSSLYEAKGKSPHAFCTDIDREGDVRVLANIVPNEYWMGTMLHELGHAVYSSKNIPASLPYVLRGEAHILCTEGVAMLFERYSKSAAWLEKMGAKVDDPAGFAAAGKLARKHRLLIFSRWCQVMLRFEKELYAHPEQDLNKLWWDLVEKYQGMKRPEGRNAPDYASKIHIVSAPCYYHNYMMGELFACQVHGAMTRDLQPGANPTEALHVADLRVGKWMTERVFAPGRSLPWNALTKHATGAELNAAAFAADFKD